MCPHRDVHKYNWTTQDGKTHNQIDYTLKDGRLYSSILEVRSFSGADCVTDHSLEVAKVTKKLAVSKKKKKQRSLTEKDLISGS